MLSSLELLSSLLLLDVELSELLELLELSLRFLDLPFEELCFVTARCVFLANASLSVFALLALSFMARSRSSDLEDLYANLRGAIHWYVQCPYSRHFWHRIPGGMCDCRPILDRDFDGPPLIVIKTIV